MGQHPQLCGLPELRLFHVDTVEELLADQIPELSTSLRMAGLLRTLAEIHEGLQTTDSIERALRWLEGRRHWTTAQVFRHVQECVFPRAIVEKSPETVRTDSALTRAIAICPQARLVHLVRHPWATVASMVDAWLWLPFWQITPEAAHEYCARVWITQHERIMRLTAADPDRCFRVRIEDITDPINSALAQFCHWAGLENSNRALAAMRRPDLSPFARLGPPNAPGGFDPKFLEGPRLRPLVAPGGLAPPTNWLLHPGTLARAVTLARQFGYRDAPDRHRALRWRQARHLRI